MDESAVVTPEKLMTFARDRWRTDREIMKQTGLSRATIWRIESGRFKFHARTLGKLVKALNDG